MTDDLGGFGGRSSAEDDLIEIDLNFESMRRFQGEFSPNLSKDGLFIDTAEPLAPGSVVRFRVILPEEFVFLEGTAVVEWVRPAETATDGAPGMALRFVTLSPQNQELVEQLVQDFVDAGGTPFDLDVRPVPTDYPTDALEGAAASPGRAEEEAYRLTVRRTGPTVQEEALQALSEALSDRPDRDEDDTLDDSREPADDLAEPESPAAPEQEELPLGEPAGSATGATDATIDERVDELAQEVAGVRAVRSPETAAGAAAGETVGAALDAMTGRSGGPPTDAAEDIAEETAGTDAADETTANADATEPQRVSEPPALEWPDDPVESVEPDEPDRLDEPAGFVDEPEAAADAVEEPVAPAAQDVLPAPADFDAGPEVIDDVGAEAVGGTAFDVSMPEPDDGPDTTPVMPDRGGNDVTVTDDEDSTSARTGRRLWPLAAAAAVLLVAVAAVLLWPGARDRLAGPDEVAAPPEIAATAVDGIAEPGPTADEAAAAAAPGAMMEGGGAPGAIAGGDEAGVTAEPGEGSDAESPQAAASDELGETPAAGPEPDRAVALARADTVTGIEVEPGVAGTVLRIRANGGLGEGVISMEKLASPPRVLVRVRGIVNPYRPYTVEGGTAEVSQARIGHHVERRPPELWIVVDLTDPDARIGGVDIRDGIAELVLAGD